MQTPHCLELPTLITRCTARKAVRFISLVVWISPHRGPRLATIVYRSFPAGYKESISGIFLLACFIKENMSHRRLDATAEKQGSSFTVRSDCMSMRAPPSIRTAAHASCPSRRATSKGADLLGERCQNQHGFQEGGTQHLQIEDERHNTSRSFHITQTIDAAHMKFSGDREEGTVQL